MTLLFKNYEECESVIIKMSSGLSDESIKRIVLAINVCNSLHGEKDKIYRLTQTYIDCLWDIPDAVSVGFHKYFRQTVKKTKALLQYHRKHCPQVEGCLVCKDVNTNIKRMRNTYERQRPEICS